MWGHIADMLLPICARFRYANGDSPYVKFPVFLPVRIRRVSVCIRGLICDVSAIFPPVARWSRILCTHAHTLTSKIIAVSHYLASPSQFAFRDISQSLSICDISYVQFYPFMLLNMESQVQALPELGGVPALPPFPQEALKEHSTKQEGAALT
jgi:hypothetical protein